MLQRLKKWRLETKRQYWWLVVLEHEKSYQTYVRSSGFLGDSKPFLRLESIWAMAKKQDLPQESRIINIQYLGRMSKRKFFGASAELVQGLRKA